MSVPLIGYALFLEVIILALLNNIYVFCEEESVEYSGESTSHPVEKGIELTDSYKRSPIELSISGKIVDNKKEKAKDILNKLNKLKNQGSLIKYVGCISLGNMQIQNISVTSTYQNWGGYNVEISLKEIRVAKSAYDAAKSARLSAQANQGNNSKVYHTVKKGDCIWSLCITGPYKNLKPSYSKPMDKCRWVMSQNQSAFSRRGDFRTLQIGRKIYVGYR